MAEEGLSKKGSTAYSHEPYFRLFDNFPNPIWMSGLDAKCFYFNKGWLEFTGRTMEQELGDGWAEGVHPEDLERCVSGYREAFGKREPFLLEYRLRHNDGTFHTVLDYGSPFHDVDGNFMGYIGSCYDATERDLAVQERERLFNLSVDLLCIAGADGYFKSVNPAFTKTLGYSEKELLEKPYLDFIHPEDRAATIAEVQKQLAGGLTVNFKNRYICKDGSVKWLSWKAFVVKNSGVLYATARDITEEKKAEDALRESEALFRTLTQVAPTAIFRTDPAGNATFVSEKWQEMTGQTPDESRGVRWADAVHPEDRERAVSQWSAAVMKNEVFRCEYRVINKNNNRVLWVMAQATGYYKGSELIGFIGSVTDITEYKSLQEQLKNNLDEAERLNKLMVGREIKLKELRRELSDLKERAKKAGST